MTTLDARPGDAAVVVAAGGSGVRLGPGGPKALRLLGGEPMFMHALRRLVQARSVGFVVVAAPPHHDAEVRELLDSGVLVRRDRTDREADGRARRPEVVVVAGGERRQESVAAALAVVPAEFDLVLVHDAARALVPPSLVDEVAKAVRSGHDAVVPARPVVDTIAQVGPAGEVLDNPDRSALRAVQTPQGFRRGVLLAAHHAAPDDLATDDAGLVARLGVRVRTIPGSERAMKITTPYDLMLAELLLAREQG